MVKKSGKKKTILRAFGLAVMGLLMAGTLDAQSVSDDFEGNGNITTWAGDNCGMNNNFANPFPNAANPSATVLEYTDTGAPFANVRFDIGSFFNLSTQPVFSLKIYIASSSLTGNQPNQISLKLQDNSLGQPWTTQCEIIKPVTPDQWQTVTFDFANDPYLNFDPNSLPPVNRADFSRVVLQVNGENNNDLVTAYLDDFVFQGTTGSTSIYTQLVWSDEFNGSGAIDPLKWHHQTQFPDGNSWFNGEHQHYTDRVDNSYQSNGDLYIMAKRESFFDQGQWRDYTSARLNSKFAFTYGRVEVRAKMPFGLGTWPAIWMLGRNISEPGAYWYPQYGTTGWPACGEIDIIEHWGYNPNYVQSALHTPSSFGSTVNLGGVTLNDAFNTYHVYEMEWSPTEIAFSIDGNVHYVYTPSPQNTDTWPFTAEQYIILNVAMVGNVDPNFTQSPMVIDYVRVYQEPSPVAIDAEQVGEVRVFPNPAQDRLQIQLPESYDAARIEIYSPTGQLLHSALHGRGQQSIDLSGYPAGLYLVNVSHSGGRSVHKVLKQD